MRSGLFINNEILTLVTTNQNGELQYSGYNGDNEVFLFFHFDKSQDPPLKLNQDARSLYYPGNPEILGELLKFTDSPLETFEIFGKEFNRLKILKKLINDIISDHNDLLFDKDKKTGASPFQLIVPPFLSEKLQNEIITTIPEKLKPVRIINYTIPYLHSLLAENKLPKNGNVLYVDMSFSDIYFQLAKTSFKKGSYEIKIEEEDKIADTELVFNTIQMVAEELVDLALDEFGFAVKNDKLNREHEFQHLIPDAQDILTELNTVEEWNSIEFDLELSDGSSGSVLLLKENLQKKFNKIVEGEGIEGKVNQLLKKYKPKNIVLVGENTNNPLLLDFFNSYQQCTKINHQSDYYRKVCQTVFENIDDAEEQATASDEALTLVETSGTEQQMIPSGVHEVTTIVEEKKTGKRKGILIKILIPVLILIAAFLIYKYIPILSYKVSPENIEFSSVAGEIKLLKVSSFGEWNIENVPEWIKLEKLSASGTDEVLIWTADENGENNSRTSTITVLFGNNISKSIEIVQHGINKDIGTKTTTVNDSVSLANNALNAKWSYNDLNSYIEGIRGSSEKIDLNKLFNYVNPNCEVYYYINGEKISSEDINTFINKIKFGGAEKVVPNSLKYNSEGILIEFGQE